MQLQKGRGCQAADIADVENAPKLKQFLIKRFK